MVDRSNAPKVGVNIHGLTDPPKQLCPACHKPWHNRPIFDDGPEGDYCKACCDEMRRDGAIRCGVVLRFKPGVSVTEAESYLRRDYAHTTAARTAELLNERFGLSLTARLTPKQAALRCLSLAAPKRQTEAERERKRKEGEKWIRESKR